MTKFLSYLSDYFKSNCKVQPNSHRTGSFWKVLRTNNIISPAYVSLPPMERNHQSRPKKRLQQERPRVFSWSHPYEETWQGVHICTFFNVLPREPMLYNTHDYPSWTEFALFIPLSLFVQHNVKDSDLITNLCACTHHKVIKSLRSYHLQTWNVRGLNWKPHTSHNWLIMQSVIMHCKWEIHHMLESTSTFLLQLGNTL